MKPSDYANTTNANTTPQQARSRRRLAARELPLIAASLSRLEERLGHGQHGVLALILFGSVARLTPKATSDVDLLALLHDRVPPHDEGAQADALYGMILDAFYPGESEWADWGASLTTADARASDLDEDFLAVVGREGVLLYRHDDAALPPALAHLATFDTWIKRVQGLVAPRAS